MSALSSAALRGPTFEPICELGRGGMGTVQLVRLRGPEQFARLFVLKRLRDDRADEEAALRFAYEGRVASVIRHAHVVQTHHVGHDEQGLFLLLDYVEGASLEQLLTALARNGQFVPHPIVLRIALDALAGLGAVHEAKDLSGSHLGVLHRDVTLQNILIGVDGLSRLADFGIAKTKSSPVVTNQDYVLGKLRFLAPEYVRREEVTPSIDVYSLGVSVWHALTGRVLWGQANEAELLEHVLLDGVPPVSTHVAVSPALEAIVRKACAREPSQRFASAREMGQALEASGLPVATHGEVGELVQRVFAAELAGRRQQLAEVTARPRRHEAERSSLPAPAPRPPRAAWFWACAATLAVGGVIAAVGGQAEAPVEPGAQEPAAARSGLDAPASAGSLMPQVVAVPEASAAAPPGELQPAPVRPRAAPVQTRSSIVKRNPYRE